MEVDTHTHTNTHTVKCTLPIHNMPYGLKLIKLLGDVAEADWKLMSFCLPAQS